MKFRYIGADADPPRRTVAFGVEFTLGEVSDVTDPRGIAKLTNNRCFEVVKRGRPRKADASDES